MSIVPNSTPNGNRRPGLIDENFVNSLAGTRIWNGLGPSAEEPGNHTALAQLSRFPHFVCYALVEKKNPDPARPWKKDKIPINSRTGGNASVSDPATWAPSEVALAASKAGHVKGRPVHGVGFVFWKGDKNDRLRLPADPFVGIDLDDCRNPETRKIEPWAQDIIDRLDSYTEVSPSGHGVKILAIGVLPGPGGPSPINTHIEMYDRGRFFALTGERLEGTPDD